MSDASLFLRRSPAKQPVPVSNRVSDWWWVRAGLALALGALVVAYGATFADMTDVWWSSQTYEHSLLVLPTLAYVLWDWRGRIGAQAPRGSLIGLPMAALCGLVWLAAGLVGAAEGQHIAVVAAVLAVILATLGRAAFRAALLPLLLLAFLVPTGQQLLPALKSLTVWFAVTGPGLAGLPTEVNGYQVSIAGAPYRVLDECAALGNILASAYLGLTMGLLFFRRTWKMLLFATLGSLLAILVNGLRVNAIVLYNHLQSETMSFDDHLRVGWAITAVSLAGLLALAYRWRDPRDEEASGASPMPGQPRRAVTLGFAAAALFILVPYLWPLAEAAPATSERGVSLPEQLGSWRLSESETDWRPQAGLADQIVEGAYSNGERDVSVFIATAASLGAEVTGANFRILHDRTWWIPAQGPTALCDAAGCLPVAWLTLDERMGPRVKEVRILQLIDGEPMASVTRMRLNRAWQRLRGKQAEAAVIVLSAEMADSLPDDLVLDLLRRLTAVVAPNAGASH